MAKGLPGLETDAYAAYHFAVEIDGVEIAQFSELGGISSEIDVIELKENSKGGKPVIKKLPGMRKPPTITLKRGLNNSMALYDWHKSMYDGKVADARKNGSIILND